MQRLKALLQLWQNGHIDLLYGDETGFNLNSNVPYGWQPIGQQWAIPAKRKQVINVFGLMDLNNRLRFYPSAQIITSKLIVEWLDDFVTTLDRLTVIVWDRAPWHTAQLVQNKRPEWEEKGLYLFYLPPYSPHLNQEEILWRMVKHRWLKPKHYRSASSLKRAVMTILQEFGTTYKINFSMNY